MCMAAVLLPGPWEARAGMLGSAGLAPPSGGSRPTLGLGCCKTTGMVGGWLESKVQGKGAAKGPRRRGYAMEEFWGGYQDGVQWGVGSAKGPGEGDMG